MLSAPPFAGIDTTVLCASMILILVAGCFHLDSVFRTPRPSRAIGENPARPVRLLMYQESETRFTDPDGTPWE